MMIFRRILAVMMISWVLNGALTAKETNDSGAGVTPRPYFFERELPADPNEDGVPNVFRPVFAAANAEAGAAWVPRVKTWSPGSDLRVCFYGNNNVLNRFVASNAAAWNEVGANVTLNFGSMTAPRRCAPGVEAAIRVAYNTQGANFSKYGVDSMVSLAFWDTPSMQLDTGSVQGQFGRSIVIHEFGHALGLFHEHQKPIAEGCEAEFDWPRVYASSLQWQGWDKAMVDSQFRQIDDFYEIAYNDTIDQSSVMLYAMSPQEFIRGSLSHCFIAYPNSEISASDAEVLRAAYTVGIWDKHQSGMSRSIAEARDNGQTAVARALALYILSKDRLDQIAEAYSAEQAFGFNPAPGEKAGEQLASALDALVAEAR